MKRNRNFEKTDYQLVLKQSRLRYCGQPFRKYRGTGVGAVVWVCVAGEAGFLLAV